MSQGGQWIGEEILDVPLFSLNLFGCPTGSYCRNSDAAIIDYNDNVSSSYGIGFTGLPVCTGTQSCENRLTLLGTVSVTDQAFMLPTMNQVLNKTGQRTGWTRGPVINTCTDTPSDPIFWPAAGGVVTPLLLCQSHVQAHANNGDSGSPVYIRYTFTSGVPGFSTLYGILWGGNNNRTVFYFSSMNQIEADLGPMLAF